MSLISVISNTHILLIYNHYIIHFWSLHFFFMTLLLEYYTSRHFSFCTTLDTSSSALHSFGNVHDIPDSTPDTHRIHIIISSSLTVPIWTVRKTHRMSENTSQLRAHEDYESYSSTTVYKTVELPLHFNIEHLDGNYIIKYFSTRGTQLTPVLWVCIHFSPIYTWINYRH